ncbi:MULTISPECIES: GyrI-like domain-containing protein [unclassified Paenibacillus]|uniref:GyrI-like domain-containing protein n=1 Tax=unclassified Paenibacillus TaxID=185978 RepID=UPI0036352B7F
MVILEQRNESTIITKESFQAVGLKWEGTFAEAGAGGIRAVHTEIKRRLQEIRDVLYPDILLGLSYHINEGGFTHYSVMEVESAEHIPDGMVSITVPTLTYAKCEHKKDQNIDLSYKNMYAWIASQGYQLHKGEVTHYEEYPIHQDPYVKDPEFIIMIPIENK